MEHICTGHLNRSLSLRSDQLCLPAAPAFGMTNIVNGIVPLNVLSWNNSLVPFTSDTNEATDSTISANDTKTTLSSACATSAALNTTSLDFSYIGSAGNLLDLVSSFDAAWNSGVSSQKKRIEIATTTAEGSSANSMLSRPLQPSFSHAGSLLSFPSDTDMIKMFHQNPGLATLMSRESSLVNLAMIPSASCNGFNDGGTTTSYVPAQLGNDAIPEQSCDSLNVFDEEQEF